MVKAPSPSSPPASPPFIPPRMNSLRHVTQVVAIVVTALQVFGSEEGQKGYLFPREWSSAGALVQPVCALVFWTCAYHAVTLLLNELPGQRRVFPGTEYTVSQYTVAVFHQVVLLPWLLYTAMRAFPASERGSALEAALAGQDGLKLPVLQRFFDPLWWVCGWERAGYLFYYESQIWWALIGYQLKDFFYSRLDAVFTAHHLFALGGSALCMLSPLGAGLLTFNCVNAEFGSSTYNLAELIPSARFLLEPLYLFLMTLSNVIVLTIASFYWALPIDANWRASYLFVSVSLVLIRQAGVILKAIQMLFPSKSKAS